MKPSEPLPAKIGKYQILGHLGRGSMGIVYKALDPEIERVVAIKMLRGVFNQSDGGSYVGSLRDEARSAGNLRHSNIITVFEIDTEGSNPYIVMDFIQGAGLDLFIKQKEYLSPERIIYYLAQAALGLDYAHSKGVIHCDIKPSNLLIEEGTDNLYILDFGIAKYVQGPTPSDAPVVGTPAYMSPEQIMNEPLDGRSDLFSLGVVAFELINGTRPYAGVDLTTVMGNILRGVRVSMWDVSPNIAGKLEPIMSKVLSHERDSRYQSCAEFITELALALFLEDPFKFVGGMPKVERPQAIDNAFGQGKLKVGLDVSQVRKKNFKFPSPTITSRLLLIVLTVGLSATIMVLYLILKSKVASLAEPTNVVVPNKLLIANDQINVAKFLKQYEELSALELIEKLRDQNQSEAEIVFSLWELKNRGVEEGGELAKKFTHHPDRQVRIEALKVIAHFQIKSAYQFLQLGLSDPSALVRFQTVVLIGKYNYYELRPDLALLSLSESVSEVKEEISQILLKFSEKQ